jgi:hypothetical protein
MMESPCYDYEWAKDWLEEFSYISNLLEGEWTLETVEDIHIAEEAEKMAAALWRSESSVFSCWGMSILQLASWAELQPAAFLPPSPPTRAHAGMMNN